MTREPVLFKRIYIKHIPGQTNKCWFTFSIPIGTSEKQVKFNFSHMPLIGNISNMTKTVVVLLVWIFLLKNQNNSLLKIQSQQEYLPLWHISYIHILMESNL